MRDLANSRVEADRGFRLLVRLPRRNPGRMDNARALLVERVKLLASWPYLVCSAFPSAKSLDTDTDIVQYVREGTNEYRQPGGHMILYFHIELSSHSSVLLDRTYVRPFQTFLHI